jgi:aminopeptidase N
VHDVDQAATIFDDITYPKGASVLRQLMTYVGEDNFAAGMTAYFARHAWGNTTLQDLIDALAQTSGRPLDAWRDGWLETAGTDRLTLEHDGDALVLRGRGPDGPPRPQVVAVGAYRRDGDGLRRTAVAHVEVAGPRSPVDLPPGADLYLVNDEDLTFATTRSGTPVFAAAPQLPTPIARGVAVAEVWDMLVTGEAAASAAVDCLTAVLAVETSDSVIEPYLTLAIDIGELWAAGTERAELIGRVHTASQALAERPGLRRVALRGLARSAADLDEIAWLRRETADDVDLQWRVLVRKAELGGETADDVERLLARDPDPDAEFRALSVRAATPDPGEKAAMWRKMVDRAIPLGSFRPVAAAFWRPGQDDLLAPYPERYLELLPDMQRGGMLPAMYYTRQLFPLFSVDEAFLPRAEVKAREAAPVVRKTLLERADLIRRMLRSRG